MIKSDRKKKYIAIICLTMLICVLFQAGIQPQAGFSGHLSSDETSRSLISSVNLLTDSMISRLSGGDYADLISSQSEKENVSNISKKRGRLLSLLLMFIIEAGLLFRGTSVSDILRNPEFSDNKRIISFIHLSDGSKPVPCISI